MPQNDPRDAGPKPNPPPAPPYKSREQMAEQARVTEPEPEVLQADNGDAVYAFVAGTVFGLLW